MKGWFVRWFRNGEGTPPSLPFYQLEGHAREWFSHMCEELQSQPTAWAELVCDGHVVERWTAAEAAEAQS